ncbi:MAG: site-specific DNA-methyltransferase [Dehalococcoidia bacterium]|nr:site-specific DNA-methyltransferase [Dehalococcoidia bacterium]
MTITLLQGHVLDRLRELPSESVHCVVTSPPYFGLRDYGCNGQIGLEKTVGEYVQVMVEVFREVGRVLRRDGVCFANWGDSYNGSGGAGGDYGKGGLKEGQPRYPGRKVGGLKPKNLIGIPWRCAFAFQDDGWWLRSEITLCKIAPMPESVTDRPTSATEKIFLLTKAAKYFYDNEAVRMPHTDKLVKNSVYNGSGTNADTWKAREKDGIARESFAMKNREYNPSGRNLWNYWLLSPSAFPGSHFATFPPELPERCIKAGTSEKGCCPKCGKAWRRVVEKKGGLLGKGWTDHKHDLEAGMSQVFRADGGDEPYSVRTLGWEPSCTCSAGDPIPCTVLDPFSGAGTTLLVADRLGRNGIGIELNPEYIKLSEKRIRGDAPMLVEIVSE